MNINAGQIIPLVAIVLPFLAGIIGLFCWVIISTTRTREREKSRREIAAYVAEGSISPEDAAKLLVEHSAASEREKTKREVAHYVAHGNLTPDAAQQLLVAEPPAKQPTWGVVCATRRDRASARHA